MNAPADRRTPSFPADVGALTTHLGPPACRESRNVCVPGYTFLGELGRGGLGVVYMARQAALGRVVAGKVLSAAGPLDPGEAAALVEKVARDVGAAHRAGVVHRDLKSANVLLAEYGSPKVLDFGLAKRLDTAEGLTQTGQVVGTPSYMAPEQAAGRVALVGPAADVYGIGAVLYSCLTGDAPFRTGSVLQTRDEVKIKPPIPPRRLDTKIPRDLETVALKCLEKDPARRYASAAETADDLGRYLKGEYDPVSGAVVGEFPGSADTPNTGADGHRVFTSPPTPFEGRPGGVGSTLTLAVRGRLTEWDVATGTRHADEVYDRETAANVTALRGNTAPATCAEYASRGALVDTGGQDPTVRVYDAGDYAHRRRLVGHEAEVTAVGFRPDGSLPATGGAVGVGHRSGTIRVLPARPPLIDRLGPGDPADRIAPASGVHFTSADGAEEYLLELGILHVRSTAPGEVTHRSAIPGADAMLPTADGSRLLLPEYHGDLRVWDAALREEVVFFGTGVTAATGLSWADGGSTVLLQTATSVASIRAGRRCPPGRKDRPSGKDRPDSSPDRRPSPDGITPRPT